MGEVAASSAPEKKFIPDVVFGVTSAAFCCAKRAKRTVLEKTL